MRTVNVTNVGMYIVCIEGIDGCGKDTQLDLLKKEGFNTTTEPVYGTPTGDFIRKVLHGEIEFKSKSTLEYLMLADRSEHIAQIIDHVNSHNSIKEKLMITGRYKYSGLAYSEDQKISFYMNKKMPDAGLFIFLDIKPDAAIKRIQKRDQIDIYENMQKLTVVYDNFHQMIRDSEVLDGFRDDNGSAPEVVIINADQTPEDIHNQIMKAINDYVQRVFGRTL